jgi:hypothetical protein
MARGWESKAVEDQLEELVRTRQETAAVPKSPESIEHQRKRETLSLTRSRVLEQLQNARSDAHRQMLERSLLAIETEQAAL